MKVKCCMYKKDLCKNCYHRKPHEEVVTESRAFSYGYCKGECQNVFGESCVPVIEKEKICGQKN